MVNKDFYSFLGKHLSIVEPLMRNANLGYWNATISGSKKDFKKYSDLQVRLRQVYSSKEEFNKIKEWKNGNEIGDYLKKAVFEVGAVYKWNKMIELATEEKPTPRYFVEEFVE